MHPFTRCLGWFAVFTWSLALSLPATAAGLPTGKQWIDMDYGPSLTLTIEAGDGNFAYKGVAIRLDEGPGGVAAGEAFVVFDTDTLRCAAAWTGQKFIDWRCIHFDGQHGVHPRPDGSIVFENLLAPGWARPGTDDFHDPRLVGRDGKHYGPLPRSWAHWKGLYRHGNQVVLSYTVGETDILEMPELERVDELRGIVRTLNVGPRRQDLLLQVAQFTSPGVRRDTRSSNKIDGQYFSVPLDEEAGEYLCVGLTNKDECGWHITDGGRLLLAIPAGDAALRLKLIYARVADFAQRARFEALLTTSSPPRDLTEFTSGGPAKWRQTVTTKSEALGSTDGPYVVESLSVPHENPYRSWMRLGGFDFFADGRRAAVCTWQGDVWLVDGIGEPLADGGAPLTWRRIASGMFQPLGLTIIDGDIYVTCRDQITVLRDLNGDGETDFYENFNNDHQVTDHFHEFAVGLQTDDEGNLYYAKCARHALDALVPQHGTLLKVSKDGSRTEIVAGGYRAPNGVCVNGDGTFFLSDQEGHWVPKNRINWVRPGGFYGNMMAYHEGREAGDFEPPVCWIHNDYDRSPAEQIWVTSDKWGPLHGALISLSYGTGEVHLVLHEQIDRVMQGGLVRLPIADFPTGVMRGRFHPGDGQLYACGLFGWSSNKTAAGGFYRVRYTGQPLYVPRELKASPHGLAVTFTEPLDEASATNVRNWSAARWEYRRTQNYGSEDYLPDSPRRGRERLRIDEIALSKDQRTVHLKVRDMRRAMQMELRYHVQTADGTQLAQSIHHTVHKTE